MGNFMRSGGRAGRAQQALDLQDKEINQTGELDRAKIAESGRQADLTASTDIQQEKIKNPATGVNSENRMERISALQGMIGKQPAAPTGGLDATTPASPASAAMTGVTPAAQPTGMGGLPSLTTPATGATNQLSGITQTTGAMGEPLFKLMKQGGPVAGPGPDGVDNVPILAQNGEYVLPPETVAALGGLEVLDRIVAATTGKAPNAPGEAPVAGLEEVKAPSGVQKFADAGGVAPVKKKEDNIISRNFPRTIEAGRESAEKIMNSPTVGTTAGEALRGVIRTGGGAFLDAAVPVEEGIRNFANEVWSGEKTQAQRSRAGLSEKPASTMPAAPAPAARAAPPNATPQPHPAARQAAEMMQTAVPQRSEQELLNVIGGANNRLTREAKIGQGNIFKNEDLTKAGAQDTGPGGRWSTNADGTRRYNASAQSMGGKMMQEAGTPGYRMGGKDSGVTYSDSVGGATEWATEKANLAGPEAAQLQGRYQQDANTRGATRAQMGLDGMTDQLSAPQVDDSSRGQQITAQRDYAAQAPARAEAATADRKFMQDAALATIKQGDGMAKQSKEMYGALSKVIPKENVHQMTWAAGKVDGLAKRGVSAPQAASLLGQVAPMVLSDESLMMGMEKLKPDQQQAEMERRRKENAAAVNAAMEKLIQQYLQPAEAA